MMRGPIGWIVGAVIGGGIGAAIWAAIAYFTGFEVGYIAVLVGALAGLGTNLLGQDEGIVPGIIAAAAAILAVAIGKYAAVDLGINQAMTEIAAETTWGPDDGIAAIADGIIEQREAAGQTINWPEPEPYDDTYDDTAATDDESWDNYSIADDYPEDVWAEAAAGYDRMPHADQQQWIEFAKRNYESNLASFSQDVKGVAFAESFSLFDLLWLALAVGAAFKLGSSGVTDDE